MFPVSLALLISGAVLFAIAPKKGLHYAYLLYAAGAAIQAVSLASALYTYGAGPLPASPAPASSFHISPVLALTFKSDPLQDFFGLLLSVLALAASVYSSGYMKNTRAPRFHGIFYGLFILSMGAVFFSGDALSFLISWEAMSLVSYFLVVSDTESDAAQSAGLTYATMTHIGTAFIIAAFMLAYSATGSLEFSGMAAGLAGKSAALKSAIFILSFIGFGMKAGIVPLHIWLPRAHPAAPSNVSALMSGVMIKAGIYGIIFMCFGVLGTPSGKGPAWWGIVILVTGAASSVFGVLYALMEQDLKRLLAYSSVENIGIILLGTGASVIFYSFGQTALAGLALAAALYHTMNHAVFKGLLFLGSGSVMHGAHSKNLEDMGGLLKRMPYTGLFFLMGSVSICALPPFNGFVSEWLTFQSLILGSATPPAYSRVITLLGGAALALTGALAAAAFVKAFGVAFLGMPRSKKASEAKEAGFPVVLSMGFLAALCLLLGIAPSFLLRLISALPFAGLQGMKNAAPAYSPVTVAGGFSGFWPAAILFTMLAGLLVILILAGTLGEKRKITYAGSWDCGIKALTPRMQYTATAFTKPLRVIFKTIYMPTKEVRLSFRQKPIFVSGMTYHSDITPFLENFLYKPLTNLVDRAAMKIRHVQSGSLPLYLGYIMLTLIGLLMMWAS